MSLLGATAKWAVTAQPKNKILKLPSVCLTPAEQPSLKKDMKAAGVFNYIQTFIHLWFKVSLR
jgi:hypothetical protein